MQIFDICFTSFEWKQCFLGFYIMWLFPADLVGFSMRKSCIVVCIKITSKVVDYRYIWVFVTNRYSGIKLLSISDPYFDNID